MSEVAIKKTVKTIREIQHVNNEARDLLRDLDSLVTLKHERKLRWIWELIQNAVDCSEDDKKVNITIKLTNDKITFSHDGAPFELEQLVALVTKGSTKQAEGLDGKKGKFGTGFVSTHVLNKLVTVSGFLRNESGLREFTLDINRDTDVLATLLSFLDTTFERIDEINEKPADLPPEKIFTTFEYKLEGNKFALAKGGLEELLRDLPFTILVNSKELQSVKITDETGVTSSLAIEEPTELIPGLEFTKIILENNNEDFGLLFSKTNELTIAFPAKKTLNGYSLRSIDNQARIFRNFPLIGTEDFHSPCFIHSENFQPSEKRDGIRTFKDVEEKPDKFADPNREVLLNYTALFNETFSKLVNSNVENFHLLAESGVPENVHGYTAIDWFVKNVQKPIRDFLLKYDLVNTVDGSKIKIDQAKFLDGLDPDEELFVIVSELYSSNCPDKMSYKDWKTIIDQDPDSWPAGIYVGIEDVVQDIQKIGKVNDLKVLNGDPIPWLNKVIKYVLKIGRVDLIEQAAFYPNQSRQFVKRIDLRLDPGFTYEFKTISKYIFRNLFDEFILSDVEDQDGIQEFKVGDCFKDLNSFLGQLDLAKATEEQILAIFELCCYFRNDLAKKRNEWFDIINTLLPTYAKDKIPTNELDDYDFDSVDKWTLKYVSSVVQKSEKFQRLQENYFENNSESTYNWLNRFINYASSSISNQEIAFKFSIVLAQDGYFKKYDNNLYRENNSEDFIDLFKELVRDYVGKGDPKSYLIDTEIGNEFLMAKGVNLLTDQVDKLFNENNIEKEVEENGKFNSLFHKVNDWYTKDEVNENTKRDNFFPIFKGKRADLSVRAFGKEMSKILTEKGFAEIKALSTLKLSSSVLSQLEHAAEIAGGTQILLDKAQEIFDEAERIRWRKQVGTAAETAFAEAMAEIETSFDIENPDIGKDFTIRSKETGKEFYIEIKSTVIGEETVKMSSLQGETANQEKERYALCVITRPHKTIIDKDYFLQHAKFTPTIGDLIGDKVSLVKSELNKLTQHEEGDVNITMESKTYHVYINKRIWECGIGFNDFLSYIQNYLNTK